MEKNIDGIYEKFKNLKEKRILIYGTGVIAKRLIDDLSDFCIVGIIDRILFSGDIKGIPIKIWDDVYEGDADAIIIASLPQNFRVIYDRIVDRCIAYDMKIYGADGRNLISYYGIRQFNIKNNIFFEKSENDLIQKVKKYEAVSFDLFDTLVMRKVLEPTDLFDIVGQRIQKKGIFISDFKKFRREAELQSHGADIYEIYRIFKQMLNLSEEETDIILKEEVECEKDNIIPRQKMVEIMTKAHNEGKHVNIITNMYLPKDILCDILKEKGIERYDDIYVSCEYGVSKGGGLFQRYLEDIKAQNYLHIGDNESEDVLSARKYGIDAYGIKSAYDMLKVSNFRRTLIHVHTTNEKGMLGLLISGLFNDPFALYGTNGFVRVSTIKTFAKLFVAPIVVVYMFKLFEIINKTEEFDGILFGARDSYLFKKLYDRVYEDKSLEVQRIPCWYFMASRKLCLQAGMTDEESIRLLVNYIYENRIEEVLTHILEIENILSYDEEVYKNKEDYYIENKEEIFKKSNRTRQNYWKYLEKNRINRNGKYIFCDLISHGTSQYGLNQVFDRQVYGFYLCQIPGMYKVDAYSCFPNDGSSYTIMADTKIINLLESVLTSFGPSVKGIDEEGNPVYAPEKRTQQDLEILRHMQEGIEEFFFEYIHSIYIKDQRITEMLPEILLGLFEEVYLTEECQNIKNRKLYEDMHETYYDIFDASIN